MRIIKTIEITKEDLDNLNNSGLIEISNYFNVYQIKVLNYNKV